MQDTLHTFREVRNKLQTVEKCKWISTDAHSLPQLEFSWEVRRLCIRSTFQAWDGDASRFWGFDDCGIITLTDTGNIFLVKYFFVQNLYSLTTLRVASKLLYFNFYFPAINEKSPCHAHVASLKVFLHKKFFLNLPQGKVSVGPSDEVTFKMYVDSWFHWPINYIDTKAKCPHLPS